MEIAEQLDVSDNAIKYHIKILYRSFEVGNRVECIRYAESKGLI
ncbi:MAG: hypothetical protein JKX75_06985 [Gammaproteobacteria bacterium]|nr:hypothetical protein [Gammaproteobacteria bacterium]